MRPSRHRPGSACRPLLCLALRATRQLPPACLRLPTHLQRLTPPPAPAPHLGALLQEGEVGLAALAAQRGVHLGALLGEGGRRQLVGDEGGAGDGAELRLGLALQRTRGGGRAAGG